LAVAGLSAGAAFAARGRFPFAAARAVLITGGLAYSAYLTYHQFAGLGALCALCLTSAAIALTLFLVQAAALARPSSPSAASSPDSFPEPASAMTASSSRRPALWAGAALALLALVGADVAYFSSLDSASAAEPVAAAEKGASPGGSAAPASSENAPTEQQQQQTPARSASAAPAPATADTTEEGALPSDCGFAEGKQTMDPSRMVSFGDAVFGASDAPVTVVEFFDPNCPHCKTFNTTMKQLQAQYGDRARFVYKPIPLWPRSVNQVTALHAASKQGKFKKMLGAQFDRQQRGGLTDEQLSTIASEVGMNPDPMRAQIQQGAYQQQIQRDRQLAKEAGVQGTPAVAINGRLVARRAKTASCLDAMIERELESS
jgi:protein-disulfide isomerase